MAETAIEIQVKGTYRNIYLNTIKSGDYIIVKKRFAEAKARESPSKFKAGAMNTFYSCGVEYKGENVSFLLNKAEDAAAFNECGGIGDSLKITHEQSIATKSVRGVVKPVVVDKYTFEKV